MKSTCTMDYSQYFKDDVTKLAANGVLLSEDGGHLLVQVEYKTNEPTLLGVDAPVDVEISFNIEKITEDQDNTIISGFDANGAPGQCYNFAVHKFNQLI